MFERIFGAVAEFWGSQRSPKWNHLRDKYLERDPSCRACGKNEKLEVHHIVPVFINPELELNECNLISLCRDCHFYFGHLLSWKSYNKDVEKDAMEYLAKVKSRP